MQVTTQLLSREHDHDHERTPAPEQSSSCCAANQCDSDQSSDSPPEVGTPSWRWFESLGAAAGIGLALAVPHLGEASGSLHGHGGEGFAQRFLVLALQSSPALLLGFVLAGVLTVMLPRASVRWLGSGGALSQSAKGVAFGLPLPICSCGVVPMYQSLVKCGAPPAAAMAFLVATPEIGIEAIVLSVPFLGVKLTVVRLVAAGLVALGVGWLVGRGLRPREMSPEGLDSRPWGMGLQRLRSALRFGLVEIVDAVGAWLLVGLAVAALITPNGLDQWLGQIPDWLEVVGAAGLGLPIYVCASGATPLAAALILAGASPGAALAFLLAGPATNITTYGVLSSLHGQARALAFGVAMFAGAVLAGVLVNQVPGGFALPVLSGHHHPSLSWLAWASVAVLGAAFLASVIRQGPRAFLATVVSLGDSHA